MSAGLRERKGYAEGISFRPKNLKGEALHLYSFKERERQRSGMIS